MIPEWQQYREPWRYDATCAGMGPDHWDRLTPEQQINVCQDCPVITQCREWADQIETSAANTYWVYGGEDPGMRIRRRLGIHLKPRATATHCAHGHEWTPENTRMDGPNRNWRRCRACGRKAGYEAFLRRRAAQRSAKEDAA